MPSDMERALDLFSLKEKVGIVTGASRGLGYGMASALAGAGAQVILVSRSVHDLEIASRKINVEMGDKAVPFAADVTKESDLENLVSWVSNNFGKIDILVNNAGTNVRKPFLEVTKQDFEGVVASNLAAVFFLNQKVAKEMITRGGGRIINIASLTSQIGVSNVSVYAATKGGIASLTKTLSVELAQYRINVNAIAPGYYRTSMTEKAFADETRHNWILSRIPLGRSGLPNDIAGTVVFLSSSASDYITGQIIFVDGGWTAA